MAKDQGSISEQLKRAVRESGQSLWAIAGGAGIDLSTLTRFMSESDGDHRDIRLERTADKLFAYLKLKIGKAGGSGASPAGGGKAKAKPRPGKKKS